ncbi:DUF6548 family protein [Blautia sp.]|uniref:DUF6548 family protein n=1 Tax=Blautia sp. TaxID=1955243 RepID=UPI0025BA50A8|nr:DUF6548 family protein [Blautia sp.]
MGFMESYKHLDNLCKDMNGIGVTGYIKDMEQEKNGDFYVAIWKEDYRKLKHYRYIRNQIAHENDVNENNLCSDGDTAWLDSFYQRILAQTDPLALYYKKTGRYSSSKSTKPEYPPTTPYGIYRETPEQMKTDSKTRLILLLIAVVIIICIFSMLQ